MNFITKQIEKKLGVDLNGDGVIGSGYGQRVAGGYYSPGHGGGSLVDKIERVTHMDINGDGRIGGQPAHPPNYRQYGGPSYPPNYGSYGGPVQHSNSYQSGGGGLINELEKATNIDLNGDGRIGGQPPHPPNYQQYGGPSYSSIYGSYGGPPNPSNSYPSSNAGLINELEKATNIDLNGDGRIGGQPPHPPNYQQYGGPSYPSTYDSYGGPPNRPNSYPSGNVGLINELEKTTNIDLNGDGRIGGQPPHPPNYQQYGGPSYPSTYDSYGGPPNRPNSYPSGNAGLINELEKTTNIDLNGDGRIGGQPPHPPNYQQYGGPSYPPTYGPYGGPANPSNSYPSGNVGLINELEKTINIDLNGDGRIGGQPPHPPNYQQYGGPSYPPNYGPYGGPANPSNSYPSGSAGLMNELEKATNIDLNGDGRIGGQPPHPPNYQQYGGPSYPSTYDSYGGPPNPSNSYPSGNVGLINELEKATNIDLNGDGRIGGQPPHPPSYQQYGGPSYPPTYGPYGGPGNPSNSYPSGNAGLINELEKATNIDLNGDGRIGGQPTHPLDYNPYGYGH